MTTMGGVPAHPLSSTRVPWLYHQGTLECMLRLGGALVGGLRKGLRWGALAALGLTLPLCAVGQLRAGPQYRAQTWQSDSGLPQNTVHAVMQTRDGFLWLATEGGLVRFDGFHFKVYDAANTPEFRSDLVDGLLEDKAGDGFWAATSDGLLHLKAGRFRAFRVEDGLPSNVVTGVYRQGVRLVVATAGGLAVRDGERFRAVAGTEVLGEAARVQVLPEDAQGTLWASAGQRLLAVRAGAMVAQPAAEAGVGSIHALAAGADGAVWVGGADGLACVRTDGSCMAPGAIAQGKLLPGEDVTALAEDKAGELWVGTEAGLRVLRGGAVEALARQPGLGAVERLLVDAAGAVWVAAAKGLARVEKGRVALIGPADNADRNLAMFEDREGDLWLGSEAGGVRVLRVQPFQTLTTQQGLSADFVRTVFQDHAGAILIGTDRGGLDRLVGGKITPVDLGGPSASGVVLALAETGEGVWVGTPDGLTLLRSGQQPRTLTVDDGLADNFVRSLFADRDGTLWVGTRNGLSHWAANKFVSYTSANGLGSDVIGSVLRTRDGTLWVGTLGGLSRWNGTRFVNATARDGLGGDAVTVLFEDSTGTLLVGTNGSGLTRFRDGKFVTVDARSSGLPETVYGIVEDAGGHIWLSSKQGIYRVQEAALDASLDGPTGTLAVERFGAADGMQIGECSSGGHPAAWRMQDGTLWFATLKGVALVNPAGLPARQIPPVVIERVTLDGQEADAGAGAVLEVPAGSERIAVEYAGLSLAAPQKVRYRYKLAGFDQDWVQAGSGSTAFFTNIPPGHYRFVVQASNTDGIWSVRPAEIILHVRPRFFQTWWFYLLLAAGLLWLAYAIYRLRVRFVEARLKGVMTERGRIAREIHDTLAQGYVGISVHLEIASQMLAVSTEAAREQLEETKALVRSGLAEARSSIWELRSDGEEVSTLPARLTSLAKAKQHDGGPEITVAVHGSYRPLQRRVEDEIVRVAQEAIANVLRHADAQTIAVSLAYDAKKVELSVQDDGRGFAEAADSFAGLGHFGLRGMQERAAAIGGVLDVQSSPGRGTSVNLRVPLQKES